MVDIVDTKINIFNYLIVDDLLFSPSMTNMIIMISIMMPMMIIMWIIVPIVVPVTVTVTVLMMTMMMAIISSMIQINDSVALLRTRLVIKVEYFPLSMAITG